MVGQSARALKVAEALSDNFSESEKNQYLISRYMLDIRNILNQLCHTAEKKTRRADMGHYSYHEMAPGGASVRSVLFLGLLGREYHQSDIFLSQTSRHISKTG